MIKHIENDITKSNSFRVYSELLCLNSMFGGIDPNLSIKLVRNIFLFTNDLF